MWKNINDVQRSRRNFNMILTTHSMEEAEILCDTIGWMKWGNFVCKGNPEKIKLQYSEGYYLHIKFRKADANSVIFELNADNVNNQFANFGSILEQFNVQHLISEISTNQAEARDNIFYHEKLQEVILKIKPFISRAVFQEADNGNFKVIIMIQPEHQSMFFNELLTLKVTHLFIYYLEY